MQAYTPPPSLWRLVEQYVCIHEQEEVKNMLGLSLVEQSLDSHNEIDMLLDIWREMKDDEENQATSRRGLPEPPNVRERLIQEIVFFVDNVKEKAKKKGLNPDLILKQHNTSVLDYAQDQSRPGSSLGRSSRISDGRETPMMMMSPERLDIVSNLSDGIEAMNNQLNYLDFDSVCKNLRKTLEDEVEQLLKDIDFLHDCLNSQAEIRDCVTPRALSREPTLTELREERTILEKELLTSDTIGPIPSVQKKPFNNTHRVLPSTPPSPKPSSPTSRVKPLKANHNLGILFDGHSQGDASSQSMRTHKKTESKCNLAARTSRSEGDVTLSLSSGQLESGGLPLPSPPSVMKPSSPVRRRTTSPGRVRVVDVTDLVDSHLAKSCLVSTASVQSKTVTTASASDLGDQLTSIVTNTKTRFSDRPSSANRFRKLVQGFRDGD